MPPPSSAQSDQAHGIAREHSHDWALTAPLSMACTWLTSSLDEGSKDSSTGLAICGLGRADAGAGAAGLDVYCCMLAAVVPAVSGTDAMALAAAAAAGITAATLEGDITSLRLAAGTAGLRTLGTVMMMGRGEAGLIGALKLMTFLQLEVSA